MRNILYYLLSIGLCLVASLNYCYSQTTSETNEKSPMICPSRDTCIVSNFNFTNNVATQDEQFIEIVPDSVCKWDSHHYNPMFGEFFLTHSIFVTPSNYINMDPDYYLDSMQFFQELPSSYNVQQYYHFYMEYGLAAFDSTQPNELLICLTNDDPHLTYPPFSQNNTLILYHLDDFYNDSATNVLQNIDIRFFMDKHYQYLVVWCKPGNDDETFLHEFYFLQVHNLDICGYHPLQANAGPDTTICSGDTIVLGAYPVAYGGYPPYSYSWTSNPPTTGQPYPREHPTVNPQTSTWYYVEVQDSHSTVVTDSVFVRVNTCYDTLYVDAGSNKAICVDSVITLGGNPAAWGGVPPYIYSWTSQPAGFTSPKPNPPASPVVTTKYILTVTDSVSQMVTDTVNITVEKCIGWPRIIETNYPVEDPNLSCDSLGDVLATFIDCDGTLIHLHGDTTYSKPVAFGNELLFFDKNANRLWSHSLYGYFAPVIQQQMVDNQRNTYILFLSPAGYNFYKYDSLVRTPPDTSMRQYLAKIDVQGNINWVQSFWCSPADKDLVHSFCKLGDSIFVSGFNSGTSIATNSNRWITQFTFLGCLRVSDGTVDAIQNINVGDHINLWTSLMRLNSDTLVLFRQGTLYFIAPDFFPIQGYQTVFNSNEFSWFTNGNGVIFTNTPSWAVDHNGDFTQEIISGDPVLPGWNESGFATYDHLYCTYSDIYDDWHFIQYNLAEGGTVRTSAAPSWSHITGSKDLEYAFNISFYNNAIQLKLDTFGLPTGVPKSKPVRLSENGNPDQHEWNIVVFPNPAKSSCTLAFDQDMTGMQGIIELYNSLGLPTKKIIIEGSRKYIFDLQGYSAGMYYLLVKTNMGSVKKKLIIMQ